MEKIFRFVDPQDERSEILAAARSLSNLIANIRIFFITGEAQISRPRVRQAREKAKITREEKGT